MRLHLSLAPLLAFTACATPRPNRAPGERPPKGLLILAPASFREALEPFVEHRRKQLPVRLFALEDLLARPDGVDDAEKVKRFLYEEWRDRNLGYALFVGDADVFPVRYMMLDRKHEPAFDVAFYPSDLYYGDLARADGTFDDWNGARAGIHAHYFGEVHGEHHKSPPVNFDGIDYRPEIAVGRWPVSTVEEARALAAKTIAFDSQRERPPRAAFVATGGWVDARGDLDRTAAALPAGWQVERLYFDGERAPTVERVVALLNEGATIVCHAGHGGASTWEGCLSVEALAGVHNEDRLPILASAGCGTASFATLPPYEPYVDVLGVEHPGTNGGEVFKAEPPPPACYQRGRFNSTGLGEALLRRGPSGAVGYFGCNTGSQPCGLVLLEEFVTALGDSERLGDLWKAAVTRYFERERLPEIVPTEDWYPASIFFQGMKFMLFGDPSLRLPRALAPRDGPESPRSSQGGETPRTAPVSESSAPHPASTSAAGLMLTY